MKILIQFGIFIRIIILNIGGKKAYTQKYKDHEAFFGIILIRLNSLKVESNDKIIA